MWSPRAQTLYASNLVLPLIYELELQNETRILRDYVFLVELCSYTICISVQCMYQRQRLSCYYMRSSDTIVALECYLM